MALIQTTAPTAEPVSVAQVKAFGRIDANDVSQDQMIAIFIGAAREAVQQICRSSFATQSWKLGLDKFPSPSLETSSANWYGPAWGVGPGPLTVMKPDGKTQFEIVLPMPPLQTVDSIKYYDAMGVFQTLAPAAYLVDSMSQPARITPAYGTTWPATLNRANAVEITFTAGSTATVPFGVMVWMLQHVLDSYENREAILTGQRGAVEINPKFDRLLDPYRVVVY